LFYQLFFSDNSGFYNQKINEVNKLITLKEYKKAFIIITDIKKTTIFENSNLNNCSILLAIKLDSELKDALKLTNLTNFQKAIILTKLKRNTSTLSFLKSEITFKNNDSLIKLYEIFSSIKPDLLYSKKTLNRQNLLITNNETEALILLDLMKKKEKFLIYNDGFKSKN
jgi:hypothetical protein